ncbi:MAG: hypothetical protein ABL897_07400 [Hyphomicrobium sp.]
MSKEKVKAGLNETPPVKPWCYRVGRTGAKKFGARENWPRQWRDARTKARRSKRVDPGEQAIEELLLIAQSKAGGLEGQIARAKLRAMKTERDVSAEEIRQQICDRLTRPGNRRTRTAPPQGGTS